MSAWKSYNPQKPKRAPNISEEEWQVHKDAIALMHRESYTHAEMLEQLRTDRNFKPSKCQLVARLKIWNFMVHNRPLLSRAPSPAKTSDRDPGTSFESDHSVHNGSIDEQEPTRTRDADAQHPSPAYWLDPKYGFTSRQNGIGELSLTDTKVAKPSRTAHEEIPAPIKINASHSEITRIRNLASRMGISTFWNNRMNTSTSLTDYMEELSMIADLLGVGGNSEAANAHYGFLVHCFPEKCKISELPLAYGLIYETYRIRLVYCRQDRVLLPSDIPMPASLAQMHKQILPPLAEVGVGTRSILFAMIVLSDAAAAENRRYLYELCHIATCPIFVESFCSVRAWIFAAILINRETICFMQAFTQDTQSFIYRLLAYLSRAWNQCSGHLHPILRSYDYCDCSTIIGTDRWQLRIIACLIFSVSEASGEAERKDLQWLMVNRLCLDACKPFASQWECLVESLQRVLTRRGTGGKVDLADTESELFGIVTGRPDELFAQAEFTSSDIQQINKLMANSRIWESYANFQSHVFSQLHTYTSNEFIQLAHRTFVRSFRSAVPTLRLPDCPSFGSKVPWLSAGHRMMLLHAFSLASLAVDYENAGNQREAMKLYCSVCDVLSDANAVVSEADAAKHGAVELLRKYRTRFAVLSGRCEILGILDELAEEGCDSNPQDHKENRVATASRGNLPNGEGTSSETHEKDHIQDAEHIILRRQRQSGLRSSTSKSDYDECLHTPQRRIADLSSWPTPKPNVSNKDIDPAEIERITGILGTTTVNDVSNPLAVGTGDDSSSRRPFPRYGEYLPTMTNPGRASMTSTDRSSQRSFLGLAMRTRNLRGRSKKSTHSSRMSIDTRSSWSLHHAAGYAMSTDSKSEAPSQMNFVL